MATSAADSSTAAGLDTRKSIIAVFYDCDDMLYSNNWQTANLITARIEQFCTERLGLALGRAYELYQTHGTCLRGLQKEQIAVNVPEYLHFCHALDDPALVGVDLIKPDPRLRSMLERAVVPQRVFTASVKDHAINCLKALGVVDLLPEVYDVVAVDYVTKHEEEAYAKAMNLAGLDLADRAGCLFLDDSVNNITVAKRFGWQTVLVGSRDRNTNEPIVCPAADHVVESVHALEKIFPELFRPKDLSL